MKSAYFLVVTGLVTMAWGVGDFGEGTVGVASFAVGFLLITSGLVMRAKKAFDEDPTTTVKNDRDTPALIRFTGVVVAMLSLAVPYMRNPVGVELQGLDQSFLQMLMAAATGGGVQVSSSFVLLVAVVFVGAFLSIFHHYGGYLMLLASSSVVFLTFTEVGAIEAVPQHLDAGMALMVLAALIVVSSAFSHPDTGFSEGSDWATKRKA